MRARVLLAVMCTAATLGTSEAASPGALGGERPLGPAFGMRAVAQDCSGMTEGQPVGEFDYAYTSDVGLGVHTAEAVLDDTLDVAPLGSVSINALRWWGISWEWNPGLNDWEGYCGADDTALTPFKIIFYSTGATRAPACPVAERIVVPTIQDSGLEWDTGFPVMEYEASFDPVAGTDVSWIVVERLEGEDAASGNPCYFLRINEAGIGTYDDAAYQVAGVGLTPDDLPYCVNTAAWSPPYPDITMFNFERGFLDCFSAAVE